jgi:putative inorganic carbon (HCO3(-)) transporter
LSFEAKVPIERMPAYWQRVKFLEGLVLLIASPFLLFPQQFILLTAVFLLLLAGLWIAPLIIVRSPLIPASPYNAALVVFSFFVGVAILVTADKDLTLSKATVLILGFGIWRYMILAIQNRWQLNKAITGYLLVGLGFIFIGLLNADWIAKTTSSVPILGLYSQQLSAASFPTTGLDIHPNQVAGTIMLVLPLLVALLINSLKSGEGRPRTGRWILILATLFCGLALLLTQSRSGWAGSVAGFLTLLLVWAITMKPSRKRQAVWIVTGLIVIAIFLLPIGLGPQRIQQLWLDPPVETAVGSLSTFNFRQNLWPWAIEGLKEFPFTGTGLGTFRVVVRRLYPVTINPTYDIAHAHNVFLQVALDVGIPGLIAYVAMLLVSGTVVWQLMKKDQSLRIISAGLLAALAAFHVYGLTDTLALGSKSSILLWAIFGLLAATIRLR